MTEIEKQKCYKAMWEGIRNGREAQEVFKRTNISAVQMRFADQTICYAQGFTQALAYIGYRRSDMKRLGEVIR